MSLVESERAFAKTSTEIGARPSFMKYFADDAIVFRPHPVNYKEAMKNVPMPKNPREATLEWEPIWADIARSGDFGYTTGPSLWTDQSPAKRPPYNGFYFSFWKKQTTGEWKVVFDVGTELPGPYNGSRTFHSPLNGNKPADLHLGPEQQRSSLMESERLFLMSVQRNGTQTGLSEVLAPDARVYRQQAQPIIGIDSIRQTFAHRPYLTSWEPMHADVATSGDLGYTYGSYTVKGTPNDEKGYFLHAWKRDGANRWKLVAEVVSPLPPEAPKAK
jgi:ketosteroid isomerase-like protein